MSDPISMLNGIRGIVSSLTEQYKKLDQNRFERIISEITKQITDANIKISALLQKNLDLEKENLRLKEQLQIENDYPLAFRKGMYYADGDDIPWCPHCYEVRHIRTHLIKDPNFKNNRRYECANCGNYFSPDGYAHFGGD